MKLISLNIERSGHLRERVLPFLRAEAPDVLCLQELCACDIAAFEDMFGQPVLYAPMTQHPYPNLGDTDKEIQGVGLIAKQPLETPTVLFTNGRPYPVPVMEFVITEQGQHTPLPATLNQAVVSATVGGLRLQTTHLVVTPGGKSTPFQREQAARIIAHTQTEHTQFGPTVLCGDFNAPRGGETWAMLANALRDNTDPRWETTLDPTLHRAGPLPYVVDGIFSLGAVKVATPRLQFGVSDHAALVTTLSL
jgi:endonuclease/exonuclease/phosphatase family metal-dependent hydrolase